MLPAESGCAIEIARSVEDQAFVVRKLPVVVRSVIEVVQNRLRPHSAPCRAQLEYCTLRPQASSFCRAIEVAPGIEEEIRLRNVPVAHGNPAEIMQYRLDPGSVRFWTKLEYSPVVLIAAVDATERRGPIEIAGAIKNQPCLRKVAIVFAGIEVMQNLLGPRPCGFRH